MKAILDTYNHGIEIVPVEDIIGIEARYGWFVVNCKNFKSYSCEHLRFDP